jgi:hypothetical protein
MYFVRFRLGHTDIKRLSASINARGRGRIAETVGELMTMISSGNDYSVSYGQEINNNNSDTRVF